MSDFPKQIPYRKGELPPGPEYVKAELFREDGESEGLFWVRSDTVHEGPIRHEDVDALVSVLRWIWRHLSQHISWCRTFEDWELGFLRDTHPATEIAVWAKSTYVYLEFLAQHPAADKATVFGAITCIMGGREDRIKPDSVAHTMKKLWANTPAILNDPANFTKDGRLKSKEKHLR
jgi:hypothetical protein